MRLRRCIWLRRRYVHRSWACCRKPCAAAALPSLRQGFSVVRAWLPRKAQRARQIVGFAVPSRRAIAVLVSPSAEASTICARRTTLCGAKRNRLIRSGSSRLPSLRQVCVPAVDPRHIRSPCSARIFCPFRSFLKLFAGQEFSHLEVN